ncbi:unnamed protein product [Dicrocoelium dendriticum]|nr:unnamed protein product [Dicrocoelium dendriticum]
MKSYEDNYHRLVRVGLASVTTAGVSTLDRPLSSHSRRTSKAYSRSEMERVLDHVTLSGLNDFHTYEKYRIDEHCSLENGASGWTDIEGLLANTSDRLSYASEGSKLPCSEDVAEVIDFSLGDTRESQEPEDTIEKRCRDPIEVKVSTVEQCKTAKNQADGGEVSSSENTVLSAHGPSSRESHGDRSNPLIFNAIGCTQQGVGSIDNVGRKFLQLRILTPRHLLSATGERQRLSDDTVERGRKFVSVSKEILTSEERMESHSYRPAQRLHQPSIMRCRYRVHIPNLEDSTPLPVLVRGMIEASTQQSTRSKDHARTSDFTMHNFLQRTMRRNPMLARILRDQTTNILEMCEKQLDIKCSVGIPDSKRSHGSNVCPSLLPEVLPSHTPNPLQGTRVHMTGLLGTPRVASTGKPRRFKPKHVKPIPSVKTQPAFDRSASASSSSTASIVSKMDTQHLRDNAIIPANDLVFVSSAHPNRTLASATELEARPEVKKRSHAILVPRMHSKVTSLLHAVSHELESVAPFTLELFTQTLRRVIPEERWQDERNSFNILAALKRLGGDLLVYRHSSGHVVRFKVMSILAASAKNRVLRRQLQFSAPLQGNWLDQLLRTLSSDRPTCRLEAALTLAKLATESKLMKQLIKDTKQNVVAEIFASLLRSADYHPQSWPECYLALAFFLHYNQCQLMHDALIDRGIQYGLEQIGPSWLRLLSYVYTYWCPTVLETLSINEKRISNLLDTAMRNPLTKKVARETLAAISEYHTIDCNLFSLWRSGSQGQKREGCGSVRTKGCG